MEKIMKGGENMLKREVLYPSDMSEDGRRGDLTSLEAKSFDQEFKQQIRIKAAELIAQRNGVNYGPGADVLKEFVKMRRFYDNQRETHSCHYLDYPHMTE